MGHTSDDIDATSTASDRLVLGTGERAIPKLSFLLHLNSDWEIKLYPDLYLKIKLYLYLKNYLADPSEY